jgi:hypothetical protein
MAAMHDTDDALARIMRKHSAAWSYAQQATLGSPAFRPRGRGADGRGADGRRPRGRGRGRRPTAEGPGPRGPQGPRGRRPRGRGRRPRGRRPRGRRPRGRGRRGRRPRGRRPRGRRGRKSPFRPIVPRSTLNTPLEASRKRFERGGPLARYQGSRKEAISGSRLAHSYWHADCLRQRAMPLAHTRLAKPAWPPRAQFCYIPDCGDCSS